MSFSPQSARSVDVEITEIKASELIDGLNSDRPP